MLIVFEMTHQFSMVPGLLVGMFISMAATRFAGSVNFYDALLVQDGHELHKIKPPQDLHGWQNLPILAIASPSPIVATSLDADFLGDLLAKHPYQSFPLVLDGEVRGILRRADMLSAIATGVVPPCTLVPVCPPELPVQAVAEKLIETPAGVVLLVEEVSGKLRGIITLHDLLRGQASMLD
jgi:CIC family chloride channel protein